MPFVLFGNEWIGVSVGKAVTVDGAMVVEFPKEVIFADCAAASAGRRSAEQRKVSEYCIFCLVRLSRDYRDEYRKVERDLDDRSTQDVYLRRKRLEIERREKTHSRCEQGAGLCTSILSFCRSPPRNVSLRYYYRGLALAQS